jgi:hypothetical protein
MMKNSILIVLVGIFTLSFSSHVEASPIKSCEKLGAKKINFKLDKDVLHVGAKEGSFSKLKVKVTGGSANMHKMVVEYKNGQKEEINLRDRFGKGSESRVIDLKGKRRVIKDITFWYDSVNRPFGKATVHVFGK